MEKEIVFVLLDDFADWEAAFLAPALRAGTMPGRPASYGVKYMTPDGRVGLTVELVQQLLFGRGVVVDVLFERVHYLPQNPSLLNLYDASMASGVSAERASRHSRVNSSCPVPLAVTTLPSRTACRSS